MNIEGRRNACVWRKSNNISIVVDLLSNLKWSIPLVLQFVVGTNKKTLISKPTLNPQHQRSSHTFSYQQLPFTWHLQLQVSNSPHLAWLEYGQPFSLQLDSLLKAQVKVPSLKRVLGARRSRSLCLGQCKISLLRLHS